MTDDTLKSRIERVLADDIGPALSMDGARIEVLQARSDLVQLRLNGVCNGCPSSIMAVIMGIEQELMRHLPEVQYVEIVP